MERLPVRVRLQVPEQDRVLGERFIADGAHERPVARVYVQVLEQHRFAAEPLAARLAAERLGGGVRLQVCLQHDRQPEGLVAQVARVRPVLRVDEHVSLRFEADQFAANLTDNITLITFPVVLLVLGAIGGSVGARPLHHLLQVLLEHKLKGVHGSVGRHYALIGGGGHEFCTPASGTVTLFLDAHGQHGHDLSMRRRC